MYSKEYAPAAAQTKAMIALNQRPVSSTRRNTGRLSERVKSVSVRSPPNSTGKSATTFKQSTTSVTGLRAFPSPAACTASGAARSEGAAAREPEDTSLQTRQALLPHANISRPMRIALTMGLRQNAQRHVYRRKGDAAQAEAEAPPSLFHRIIAAGQRGTYRVITVRRKYTVFSRWKWPAPPAPAWS